MGDYVLVPVEPTEEMLAATSWPACAASDYKKMIAAAPQPVQQPDQLRFKSACEISGPKHPEYVKGYEAAMAVKAKEQPAPVPTGERFTVVAGKYDDGERNYKYVHDFETLDEALKAYETLRDYHFLGIWFGDYELDAHRKPAEPGGE